MRERYDWLVIGDHPAGLWSAYWMANKGYSVLIAQSSESHQRRLAERSQIFDPETNVHYGYLLDVYADLLNDLVLTGAYAQVLEYNRNSLFPNHLKQNKLKYSLPDYFFTGEQKRVGSVHSYLSYLSRQITNLGKNEFVFKEFINRYFDLNHSEPAYSQLFNVLFADTFKVKGGMSELRTKLIALATQSGAECAQDNYVTKIYTENKMLKGVQLKKGGKIIEIRSALVGAKVEHIEILGQANTHFSLQKEISQREPKSWMFGFACTIHPEALPPGSTSHMIWSEDGELTLEMDIENPEHYGMINKNELFLFARAYVPYSDESVQTDYQYKILMRMFDKIKKIIPFLEYHIVNIYPDLRDKKKALSEISDAFPFVSKDIVPDNLLRYEGRGHGYRSSVKGLYYANNSSYPLFREFGAIISACQAIADFRIKEKKIK